MIGDIIFTTILNLIVFVLYRYRSFIGRKSLGIHIMLAILLELKTTGREC